MQTQCASEAEVLSNSLSMQNAAPSTPVAPQDGAELSFRATNFDEENIWAEWPYCWAVDLYDLARQRFHSFHEKHTDWKLARLNKHSQQKFQREFWNSWQREREDEVLELRLV